MLDDPNDELTAKLRDVLQAGVDDESMAKLKKQIDGLAYDFMSYVEYEVKDNLAHNLSAFVRDMAERSVKSLLEGNQAMMRQYLGCTEYGYNGRSDGYTTRTIGEMHSIIHEQLSEQGCIKLRHDLVDAHKDLIQSERIKDLEDQVNSLVEQVNKANREKDAMWQRCKEYI